MGILIFPSSTWCKIIFKGKNKLATIEAKASRFKNETKWIVIRSSFTKFIDNFSLSYSMHTSVTKCNNWNSLSKQFTYTRLEETRWKERLEHVVSKYVDLSRKEKITKKKKKKSNCYRGEVTTGTFTFLSVQFLSFLPPPMFMPISTGEWPAMAQDTPRLLDPAVVVPLWRSTRWNARLSTDTTINASRRMIAVRFRSSPICLVEAGRPLAVRFLDRSTFFRNLRPGVRRLASWLATCTPCYWISESSVKISARQGLRKRSFLIQRDTPISRLLHVCIFETLFFLLFFCHLAIDKDTSRRPIVIHSSYSVHNSNASTWVFNLDCNHLRYQAD